MHITARVDYAVRTLLELAAKGDGRPVKAETLATAQSIPHKFLEAVLADLRRGGLVCSRRGPEGGYWLARPPGAISIADVIRTVEGPLASVRGERPEDVVYTGAAEKLRDVWIAVRVNLRAVLEEVSLEDVVADNLPAFVEELTRDQGAWERRRV
ncbi:Rrf2 family transcriptional regulator [Rhodococcus sp. BL-253-APC-6A1W]|uniref:RrF2 family transcriptional regulator n=1 Tax=Rhodococcus sp. BL-253-APC-6A1W TaxID=2725307 RepID=UPI00146CC7BE|nr:Rrf2 family transcriptional regulator [Rhodococcus sp. BL-253-APC-6A1W]NMD97240.1 Rrf2 family transcriptional regulator [Rhodococcus sp. BL-253-APC-6A1W]